MSESNHLTAIFNDRPPSQNKNKDTTYSEIYFYSLVDGKLNKITDCRIAKQLTYFK